MDLPHLPNERSGVRIGSRRADFQLSDRHRGKFVCKLVYIWLGGCVLAL